MHDAGHGDGTPARWVLVTLKSCNSRKQRGIPPLPRVSEGLSHSRGLVSGQWPHVDV